MMQRYFLPIWVVFFSAIIPLQSQNIELSLPDTTATNGDILSLGIKADGFDQIVSMQFTINWDPTVIEYLNFDEADLENVAIGDNASATGALRFSWFDINGQGVTLDDGSVLAFLNFSVIGSTGESTNVFINGIPLAIQVFQATNVPGVFSPVFLTQNVGVVTVVSGIGVNTDMIGNVSCKGDSTGFIDLSLDEMPEGLEVLWTGPNSFSADSLDINGIQAGEYNLVILNNEGAILIDTLFTVQEPDLELLLTPVELNNAGCDQVSGMASFSATGGGEPYIFDIGNGFQSSGTFSNLEAGDYAVTLADGFGCQVSEAFTIDSVSLPEIELGPPVRFCEGSSATLSVEDFPDILWSTDETTNEIVVSEQGSYSVEVKNEFGCAATDTVLVFVDTTVVVEIEIPVDGLCPGDSIQLLATGAETYEWMQPASGYISDRFIPNPIVLPDTSTTYEVLGMNDCGEAMVSKELEVFNPTATAGPDTCIAVGDMAQLNASGGLEYNWLSFDAPISNFQIPDPVTQPQTTAIFSISILDEFGCTTVDSVTVFVANDIESIRKINFISPNNDGKNDVLEFSNVEKFGQNSLKIYNRWGDQVYSKTDYQRDDERFDGTRNGKPLPAGNYFYVLSFRGDTATANSTIQQTLLIVRE